jgi:hypothetical protein
MKHKIKFREEETEELPQLDFFKPMRIVTGTKQLSAVTECVIVVLGREHELQMRNAQEDSA